MGTDGRDPCLHEPSKADRLRLDKRKINHILVRKQYWDGRMAITAYGSQMGTWVSWHGSRKRADPSLRPPDAMHRPNFWHAAFKGRAALISI